jgi:hypothetical protein
MIELQQVATLSHETVRDFCVMLRCGVVDAIGAATALSGW